MAKHYECLCLYSNVCKNVECPHGTPHPYWEEECHAYPLCTLDVDVACSIIYTKPNKITYVAKHLEVR